MILLHIEQELIDAAVLYEENVQVYDRFVDWERLDSYMTERQKRIVERFRKSKPREFKMDTDQEILDYVSEIKKMCPWVNFDAWMRGKKKLFQK